MNNMKKIVLFALVLLSALLFPAFAKKKADSFRDVFGEYMEASNMNATVDSGVELMIDSFRRAFPAATDEFWSAEAV